MSYISENGVQPHGVVYRFSQEEIDTLIRNFVQEKTGLELDLSVGCLDEDFDVYVRWELEDDEEDFDDAFTEEEWEKIEEIGIHPQEEFLNRNNLFEAMFDSETICYYYDFDENWYELTIYKK